MNCPKCGYTCFEDSKFCSQCGTVLGNTCNKCGERLSSDDQFCWNCGAKTSLDHVKQVYGKSLICSPKMEFFIAMFFFIAVIVSIYFCISEEFYEEELLMNSFAAYLFGMLGLYFVKKKWFKDMNSLGMILVSSGIIFFLYGFICSYIIWGSYSIDWDDYSANFWMGLIIVMFGLVVYAISYKDASRIKSNISDTQNINISNSTTIDKYDCPAIATTEPSNEENMSIEAPMDLIIEKPELNNEKVHWNTIIDGRPFRYAAFLSYIGIWIGVTFASIQTLFFIQYTAISLLSIPSIILMVIAGIGLADFKHSAFSCFMASNWISIIMSTIILIVAVFFEDGSTVFSNFIVISTQILIIIYFYKRREAYDK